MTKVKICGLMEVEHALTAAGEGADFVGMIVAAPGRRKVTIERAREISEAVHRLDNPPVVVGIFMDLPAGDVNRIAGECGLDRIQLSNGEDWEYCLEIEKPVTKVVHMVEGKKASEVVAEIEEGFKKVSGKDVICQLDTQAGGAYGGTGKTFDWEMAKEAAEKFNLIVAGGLTPENVGQLIRQVNPWGVDVASGVETDGVKDNEKIRTFIKNAKQAGERK